MAANGRRGVPGKAARRWSGTTRPAEPTRTGGRSWRRVRTATRGRRSGHADRSDSSSVCSTFLADVAVPVVDRTDERQPGRTGEAAGDRPPRPVAVQPAGREGVGVQTVVRRGPVAALASGRGAGARVRDRARRPRLRSPATAPVAGRRPDGGPRGRRPMATRRSTVPVPPPFRRPSRRAVDRPARLVVAPRVTQRRLIGSRPTRPTGVVSRRSTAVEDRRPDIQVGHGRPADAGERRPPPGRRRSTHDDPAGAARWPRRRRADPSGRPDHASTWPAHPVAAPPSKAAAAIATTDGSDTVPCGTASDRVLRLRLAA